MREQIIFKTMTKNWQTVSRRNVSEQTVPKSWPGHRKRDELAGREDGWMIDSARNYAVTNCTVHQQGTISMK